MEYKIAPDGTLIFTKIDNKSGIREKLKTDEIDIDEDMVERIDAYDDHKLFK